MKGTPMKPIYDRAGIRCPNGTPCDSAACMNADTCQRCQVCGTYLALHDEDQVCQPLDAVNTEGAAQDSAPSGRAEG